jgi:hypothetical protein
MRDLRVYFDPAGYDGRGGCTAFYSQRADGPYYRWRYAEGSGHWRFSRVRLDRPALRVLCVAAWDAVPTELRDRLGEHYLDLTLPRRRSEEDGD